MLTKNTQYLINPTGRFVVGGLQGDTGLDLAVKLSWIPTVAAWVVTAAAHSAVKILPKVGPQRGLYGTLRCEKYRRRRHR